MLKSNPSLKNLKQKDSKNTDTSKSPINSRKINKDYSPM